MSITVNSERNLFILSTDNTVYVFQIVCGKFPVHLYYGKKIDTEIADYKCRPVSFAPFYREYGFSYLPDSCLSEYVGFDSGDYRTSSLKIRNSNGDRTTILTYKGYNIIDGHPEIKGLPYAEADDRTNTLEIIMSDETAGVDVSLYYTVFEREDVISRYVKVRNVGDVDITVEKCMSLILDLPDHNYDMISLYGGYGYERKYQRVPLHYGSQSIFSRRGFSSPHFNPFIALCRTGADEENGDVYGFNFVYSGNFLDEVEVDGIGYTRVQIGIGSENFSWKLEKGEAFESPEAVMTFSSKGIGKMTRNFHRFIRSHILPPEPFDRRPVVLNTWEACYFNINENEVLRFAEAAASTGIDMLVMDDGWFGKRNNDRAGLGDWYENRDKFSNGLKSFVDKVKSYGIKFGIWIEPEMVNPDSDLYRAHPEWCIACKNRVMMESRNQYVLDLGNPAVLDYLKDSFSKVFNGVGIDYFKWDANRHLSQVGSYILPPDRQGETAHRYMLGLYELYRWFRGHFPNAMIENCSGGGGRYDLGMMKYSTMIWVSDNTNPEPRAKIQYSSSLAYPVGVMSCHVTNNKKCEDPREMQYRFNVALGGALGYELHLPNASEEIKDVVRKQVQEYRKYEDVIINGDYYSLSNPFENNYSAFYYADDKFAHILLYFIQCNPEEPRKLNMRVLGADPDAVYIDEISGKQYKGDELRSGIIVSTENSENNSKLWYLVRK